MCDLPQLSKAAEAAAYFGLKEGTFRDLVRRKKWPVYRLAHSVRYDLQELTQLARDEGEA
jgi:hypothetical protein